MLPDWSRRRLEGRPDRRPGPTYIEGFVHYWDALLEQYPHTQGAFRLLCDHVAGTIQIAMPGLRATSDWAISDKRAVRLARQKLRKDRTCAS